MQFFMRGAAGVVCAFCCLETALIRQVFLLPDNYIECLFIDCGGITGIDILILFN